MKQHALAGQVVVISTYEERMAFVDGVDLVDALDDFMGEPLEIKKSQGETRFIYGKARVTIELVET